MGTNYILESILQEPAALSTTKSQITVEKAFREQHDETSSALMKVVSNGAFLLTQN